MPNVSGTSLPRRFLWVPVAAAMAFMASCATDYTLVSNTPEQAIKDETFQYREWRKTDVKPKTVVIGIHGFSGASIDYENLAEHLMSEAPECALYAYELRGQGRDPKYARRGDIDNPTNWSNDLMTFTRMVRRENPGSRIVWFGESMGGLILSQTFDQEISAGRPAPCDAVALSSPVVKIRDDFPAWKKQFVRVASAVAPHTRISLETLAGGEEVQMTVNSLHSEQSETNSWHVEKHTLRLLVALGDMIEQMPEYAENFTVPVLIVHGGRDFFTTPQDVQAFTKHIPEETPRKRLYYPNGHHLLMYDNIKGEVIEDITEWLDSGGD